MHFFAGGYSWRRVPAYEFRLIGKRWKESEGGSTIGLSDLPEGDYRLEVRLRDGRGIVGPATLLDISIAPPWFRTWYAFVAFPLIAIIIVFILIRFIVRRAETRSNILEKLVAERTNETEATMQKLQKETQVSATLAERARLAGEIHDSLEQGFTGIQLQIETTAN